MGAGQSQHEGSLEGFVFPEPQQPLADNYILGIHPQFASANGRPDDPARTKRIKENHVSRGMRRRPQIHKTNHGNKKAPHNLPDAAPVTPSIDASRGKKNEPAPGHQGLECDSFHKPPGSVGNRAKADDPVPAKKQVFWHTCSLSSELQKKSPLRRSQIDIFQRPLLNVVIVE